MWPFWPKKTDSFDSYNLDRYVQVLSVLNPEDQKAIGGIPRRSHCRIHRRLGGLARLTGGWMQQILARGETR